MQSLLTTISEQVEEHSLPGLMIGGHAVTALGHPRATFDLDLLIPRSASNPWNRVLSDMDYRLFAEPAHFKQYEAPQAFALSPVDLMLVDDEVYNVLAKDKADTQPIPTPNAMAMIALKLHVITQPGREDTTKDWSDVLALTKAHGLSLDDEEFSAIVLQHGGESAIEHIREAISG